ncbi:MAG: hypothetical protein AB1384_01585 [Actinomycetota bacterium]
MSECVSCGRAVPAGKFFCDDCYVKMKGKRGPSADLPRPPRQPPTASEASQEETAPPDAAIAETVVPIKKASGTLTPTSSKKVISMKPGTDRAAKDKAGKKRFTVTISFSERTYAAFSRLRKGGGGAGAAPGREMEGTGPYRPRSRRAPRIGAGTGRPRLQAVTAGGRGAKDKRGFSKAIAYRDRPFDGKDLAAVAMASFAVLAIIILSFQPWARISWSAGDAASVQTVEVTGADLGAMTYACMAIAIIAMLYAVATWVFKGVFTAVDFGVVFIAAGILFSVLLFIIVASNGRFLSAAVQKAGMSVEYLPPQFERQTLWPAYAMVLLGAILGFAGLIRVSERRGPERGEKSEREEP